MNLKNYLSKITRKIFICYAGRSGSMLLSGLLDGHSQILSADFYTDREVFGFFRRIKNFDNNISLSKSIPKIKNELKEILNRKIPFMNYKKIDIKNFVNFFSKNLYENSEDLDFDKLINIYYLSFHLFIKNEISDKNLIIVIQLHNPPITEEKLDIRYNLRNAYFFLVARHTPKSIDSIIYHHIAETKKAQKLENFYIFYLEEYLKSIRLTSGWYTNITKVIRFEDIHNETEKTMKKICNFLKIDYETVLNEETIFSNQYQFFSGGKEIRNTDKDRALNIKYKIISKNDENNIYILFKEIIFQLNYKISYKKKNKKLSLLILRSIFYELKNTICSKNFLFLKRYDDLIPFFIKFILKLILLPILIPVIIFSFRKRIQNLENIISKLKFKINLL